MMDISNIFNNYDFIKLGELDIIADTKIVILYARFMHNNWITQTHSHSFYELHFPLKGSCNLMMQNSVPISVSRGQHLLINPSTNHKFTDFSEDFLRLSIAFDIQHNEHTLTENDSYTIESSSQQITDLLGKMLDEYTNKNLGYKNIVNFHIQTALIEFLRSSPDILVSENKKIDFSQKTFNKALNFIRNNISLNITTEDVAKHINLSARQLNRIFSNNINMTIAEFIRNERILRVREHLKKTTLSLQEIASLTGFNDEYILCKTFKKITGITPGKYRANQKNHINS